MPKVTVRGIPHWIPPDRLLGPGAWVQEEDAWVAELERTAAADVAARLRGVGLDGRLVEVHVHPPLKRNVVRDARTRDARARRTTTPGFTRPGTRLDAEGRMSLTPEALALALGRRAVHGHAAGRHVVDATAGCGGNAIGFARAGSQVTAIEPDPGRLAAAQHNARVYGVADRIRWIAGRAEASLLALTDLDLLFVDPPWGADWNRQRCTLADLPVLASILDHAQRHAGPGLDVWAKVPPSFATETLPGAQATAWFGRAAGDAHRVKFVVMALATSSSGTR